jgi:aspartate aminotransferase
LDFRVREHWVNRSVLAPASGFYANASVGKTQVRMAYVLKEEDLKTAVMLLEKALEVYGHRPKAL